MATFIQGFLAKIIIDTVDTTPITADVNLSRSKTALDKTVMDSSGVSKMLPGVVSGTLDFNGHISTAELNVLEVSYAKTVPVAFDVIITEGLATDGEYTGFFVFQDFTVETSAEDNWGFTASGPTDGVITYIPAVV